VRAAADYVQSIGFDAIGAHEHALLDRALDGLGAIEGVTLYGSAKERAPTIMFRVGTLHPEEAAAALAERGVAVWHGNYYAHELERFLGLAPDGALRAGFVHYNDEGDVDRLIDGVRALAER
jgi:cysteine desulfurase/selenocysteine lyase